MRSGSNFYETSRAAIFKASMLDLADNPDDPTTAEKDKVIENLIGEDVNGEHMEHIRLAGKFATASAVLVFAELTEEVNQSFPKALVEKFEAGLSEEQF